MKRYDFYKHVNKSSLATALDAAGLTPQAFDNVGLMMIIRYETDLTGPQYMQLKQIVDAHPQLVDTEFQTLIAVMYAQEFCNNVVIEFIADSLLNGIRNVDGMAKTLRDTLVELRRALSYGNVPDAITILKALTEEQKIPTFLDNTVILKYVNKLELYAGLPLTESLT